MLILGRFGVGSGHCKNPIKRVGGEGSPGLGRGGAPQGPTRVGTRLPDMLLAALPLSIFAGALAHRKAV